MKNKVMKVVLAGILAAMMTVSVFAAGSISAQMSIPETSQMITVTDADGNVVEGKLTFTEALARDHENGTEFAPVNTIAEDMKEDIYKLNKTETKEEFQEVIKELHEDEKIVVVNEEDTFDVLNMSALTDMVDVVLLDADGNPIKDAKNIEAEIEVPNIKELKDKEIRIMYANSETDKHEILECEVDFEKGTVKFKIPKAGPIMIVYADKVEAEEEA